jgi:hypothetical protein
MNEQRYRALLGLYPTSYTQQHGEAILSTLVEANRSPLREVWPLLMHAFGVRYAIATGRSLRVTFVHAVQVMCLLAMAAEGISLSPSIRWYFVPEPGVTSIKLLWMGIGSLLALASFALTLAAPRKILALPLALTTVTFSVFEAVYQPFKYGADLTILAPVLLAFVIAGKSHYRSPRLVILYFVIITIEGVLGAVAPEESMTSIGSIIYVAFVAAVFIASSVAAFVDPRIPLGLALLLAWRLSFSLATPEGPRATTLYWLLGVGVIALIVTRRAHQRFST